MITIKEILNYFKTNSFRIINAKVNETTEIIGPRNIVEATENHISFLSQKYKDKSFELLINSKASIIVTDEEIFKSLDEKQKGLICSVIIISDNPKNDMVECLNRFFSEDKEIGIHPSAVVHKSVVIGKNSSIGVNSVIDKNVKIGEDCVIGANVHIQKGTVIGNRVVIRSNSTIGNWGFGFVKNEDGTNKSFPHFGNVIIEDDVQIGSSTCVDRGSLGDTIIEKGVKIDNLVHVAHNVFIGENSLIIACTMIGGSTIIGKNSWVAPSVILRNGIKIGENTTLGMGCIVTKDVDDNKSVAGSPAMELNDFKILLKNQKEILKKLKE